MRRTSVELDEGRLAEVQEILGTRGVKDTIEAAFDEVLRRVLQQRLIDRLETGHGLDLGPEMLEQVRPTR